MAIVFFRQRCEALVAAANPRPRQTTSAERVKGRISGSLRPIFFPLRLPSRLAMQDFVTQLPQFLRHPLLRLRRLLDIAARVLDHRQQRLHLGSELRMDSQL